MVPMTHRPLMSAGPDYQTESYLVVGVQREIFDAWLRIWDELWVNSGGRMKSTSNPAKMWTPKHQHWQTASYRWNSHYPPSPGDLVFTDYSYASVHYKYGRPVIIREGVSPLAGHIYIANLIDFAKEGLLKQAETVTLERSRSVELTHTTQFDVKTTFEMGGTVPGIGVEAKITQELGLSETDEEKKARSESHSVATTVELEFPLPRREATLVEIPVSDKATDTPWTAEIEPTWGISWTAPVCNQGAWAHGYLHLTNLRNKHGASWNDRLWDQQRPLPIHWDDMDHLASWVHGYDVEWPGMRGYFDALPDWLKADWMLVLGAENRKLRIHGTQHLTAAEDPDPTVKDVTDEVKRDGFEAVAHKYHAEEIPAFPPAVGQVFVGEVEGTFGSDYGKQLDAVIEQGDKTNEILREIKEEIKLGG